MRKLHHGMKKKKLTVTAAVEVNLKHICPLFESDFVCRHCVAGYITSRRTSVSYNDNIFFSFFVNRFHITGSFLLIFTAWKILGKAYRTVEDAAPYKQRAYRCRDGYDTSIGLKTAVVKAFSGGRIFTVIKIFR